MIIYSGTKSDFLRDELDGVLDEKLEKALADKLGRHTAESEIRAWRNSLTYMGNIIGQSKVPGDATVSIEYNIPYTAKRVDMIVSGLDGGGRKTAVIVELKQWSEVEAVEGKDAVVRTYVGGGIHETVHPSYQAWSYKEAITDFNADVREGDVALLPCACLHNYALSANDPLLAPVYAEYIRLAPVFSKHDGSRLTEFLESSIVSGDGGETIETIDHGRLKPSKMLQDAIGSMMRGNQEFVLLDTQKVVYEDVLDQARRTMADGRKRTVIVRGGPGTGKTVLAVNLLAAMTMEDMSAKYVSKNQAPRKVYAARLKGGRGRNRVDNLFVGSGGFVGVPENQFDVLIADEAHRLNLKSGLYQNLGENQVKEIINASKVSVFLIDEDQRVTLKDIGTVDEITKYAEEAGSEVSMCLLDSQFRCDGSDGYLEWLDRALEIREAIPIESAEPIDYDFRIFDDPEELRREIVKRNEKDNRSRMVAGYCWNWDSNHKTDSSFRDVSIPEHGFGMSWNLSDTDTWAIDPGSIDEIGCVHTCQGLEFDYVGVIVGDDMRFENDHIVTDASKRARTDMSLKGLKSAYPDPSEAARVADRIIKNTYRVLMTRGMRGCYVYCTNKNLADHLRWNMVNGPLVFCNKNRNELNRSMTDLSRHPPQAAREAEAMDVRGILGRLRRRCELAHPRMDMEHGQRELGAGIRDHDVAHQEVRIRLRDCP